jgi:hypothetical protein
MNEKVLFAKGNTYFSLAIVILVASLVYFVATDRANIISKIEKLELKLENMERQLNRIEKKLDK